MTEGRSGRTPVLAIVLASYLMIVLDISIVITALPKIHHALGFSATGLSWVQNAYTLTFGGLLLLGARAGDILGRRRMFIVGIALFSAASLAVGVAQSVAWLLAARAVQGIGAAIIAPSTLALLSTNFPEGTQRTRAVAYYGAVAGIGASIGLVLGGVLTSWLSWRVGFFINVPIGITMILVTPRYVAETDRRPGRFDLTGALGSTLGMGALVYGIVRSGTAGWGDQLTVAALAAGVVLLGGFVFNEWRARQPIMPLRLFADRERAGSYAARILFLGAMMGFWFFITQFLQSVLGYSGFQAGLAFLPMTVVNFAVAVGVPRLTQRLGNGRLLACGLTVTLIGMAWLSRLSADTSYLMGIALPMVLIGVGQGAALSPLTASGIIRVAPEDAGAASGLVNVAHQLGGSLGLGILVTIFASVTPAPSAPRPCWRIASPSRSPPGPPCWPWRSSWSSPSSSGRSRQLTSPMPTLPGPRPRRMRSRLRPRWLERLERSATPTQLSCSGIRHLVTSPSSRLRKGEASMTTWPNDELTKVGTAEELQIASLRRDGTLGSPRTIWVVPYGDDLYVRSVNGPAAAWFRGTRVRREGLIRAGGVDKDVAFVDADHSIDDQIDAAYRTKYRRYAKSITDRITSPGARSTTIKLVPRSSGS